MKDKKEAPGAKPGALSLQEFARTAEPSERKALALLLAKACLMGEPSKIKALMALGAEPYCAKATLPAPKHIKMRSQERTVDLPVASFCALWALKKPLDLLLSETGGEPESPKGSFGETLPWPGLLQGAIWSGDASWAIQCAKDGRARLERHWPKNPSYEAGSWDALSAAASAGENLFLDWAIDEARSGAGAARFAFMHELRKESAFKQEKQEEDRAFARLMGIQKDEREEASAHAHPGLNILANERAEVYEKLRAEHFSAIMNMMNQAIGKAVAEGKSREKWARVCADTAQICLFAQVRIILRKGKKRAKDEMVQMERDRINGTSQGRERFPKIGLGTLKEALFASAELCVPVPGAGKKNLDFEKLWCSEAPGLWEEWEAWQLGKSALPGRPGKQKPKRV